MLPVPDLQLVTRRDDGGDPAALARDVREGLDATPRSIPSKYLYDARGTELFRKITRLPEYYLTACERSIFESAARDLARRLAGPFHFVELGPGDGSKSIVLLRGLIEAGAAFTYRPVDISDTALAALAEQVRDSLPSLPLTPHSADFLAGTDWLAGTEDRPRLLLFAGSNIGNFAPDEAVAFLASLRRGLARGDRLWIGFDMKKDFVLLRRAYDDAAGVTAEFNLNLLDRLNRELGADFDRRAFRFFSTWDPFAGSVDSALVSLRRQLVRIAALERDYAFAPWEPIRTERSRKFLAEDIASLARAAGFGIEASYCDARGYFCDSLWRVRH